MTSKLNNRSFNFEIKQDSLREHNDAAGNFGYFEGYAAVFGNVDSYEDVILPGAFAKTLREGRKLKLHWQHNMMKVLGSVLEAREDTNGLFIKGRINLGTHVGKEAYMLLKAGDIDSMSIGYRTMACKYDGDLRMLEELDLYEISLVSAPANEMALVTAVKSDELIQNAESVRDIEKLLHNEGFTKAQAKSLISKIKSFVGRDDADKQDRRDDANVAEWINLVDSIQNLTKQV